MIFDNAIYSCDYKYKTVNDNGKLLVWRNGERWYDKENDLVGDGYVLSLVQKIEDLQEYINRTEDDCK
jgi:hypothetical protein